MMKVGGRAESGEPQRKGRRKKKGKEDEEK